LRRAGGDIDDYVLSGEEQRKWLKEYAGLEADSRLLDIGCGDGRLATCLVEFLSDGAYACFDVQSKFVRFLEKHVAKKYPNFSFKHVDLWHSYYNPEGSLRAHEFKFPYPAEYFDIVFANSIFTHFLPLEFSHYVREINRVLKAEGIVLATYFIGNEESMRFDEQGGSIKRLVGESGRLLNHRYNNYWTRDADFSERVVIIDEAYIRKVYSENHLNIERIVWGAWCGRDGNVKVRPKEPLAKFLDKVIARKQ
jgi:SAM-dependent methyltransferase